MVMQIKLIVVVVLSYLGSSALEIFMTGESKKFENNLSTKDKAG